jgi:DNA-binding transcriptional regulator YiaG
MNCEDIKRLRYKYNLTQAAFADIVGCTQHQVCRWEKGKIQLTDKRLKIFMNRLNESGIHVNEASTHCNEVKLQTTVA